MSAGTIFATTAATALQRTLERVITDTPSEVTYPKWIEQKTMKHHFEDDLEVGGPGLASEKPEGAQMTLGTIKEGALTRYFARTFALKMAVTEEAIQDQEYDKVIDAAKRLKRAMDKTIDVDCTLLLMRAFDPNYVGGDGQPLASANHTLPHGGTFSNTMATPMSPSRSALIVATTAIRKLPGHDGIIEGYEPKKIVCPVDQWAVWGEVLGSQKAPEPGQFNAINVVHDLVSVVPIKYWTNTTTNWGIITDCDGGLNLRMRSKPRSIIWKDNDNTVLNYGEKARWGRGWSNPRGFYGVQA